MKLLVALVKSMSAPEILAIEQPGNLYHQAGWYLVHIK